MIEVQIFCECMDRSHTAHTLKEWYPEECVPLTLHEVINRKGEHEAFHNCRLTQEFL